MMVYTLSSSSRLRVPTICGRMGKKPQLFIVPTKAAPRRNHAESIMMLGHMISHRRAATNDGSGEKKDKMISTTTNNNNNNREHQNRLAINVVPAVCRLCHDERGCSSSFVGSFELSTSSSSRAEEESTFIIFPFTYYVPSSSAIHTHSDDASE
jgi:hypothetical protein